MSRSLYPLLLLVTSLLVVQASGAAIAGLSFLDANGDGRYDMQVDSPLPGWEVRLFSQDGRLVATNMTDQNGFFVFDELPSGGTYLVEEVRPRGWSRAGGAMRSVLLSSENQTAETIFHLDDDAGLRVRIPEQYVVFSARSQINGPAIGSFVSDGEIGPAIEEPGNESCLHTAWRNGQEVPFQLSYDPKTGEVVYTVGGRVVSWTIPEAVRTPIVHLALHARADAPGTRVDLFDLQLTAAGKPQVVLSDSGIGGINTTKGVSPRGHDVLYVDADGIYGLEVRNLSIALSGRQRLTWDPLNPPSSASFGYVIDAGARTFPESQIRYANFSGASADTVQTSSSTEPETPEPTKTVKETETPEATKTVTETETPIATEGGHSTDTGSISGSKWHDLDGDHKWDGGEPTLTGWTIYLEKQEANGSDWIPVGSTTTDASGRYEFTGLAEGHYRVYEIVPPGWEQTYPTNNAGMHNLDISNGQPSWAGQDFGNLGEATATPTETVTTAVPTGTETPVETATPTVTIPGEQSPTETVTPTPDETTVEPTETVTTVEPTVTITEGQPPTETVTPTPEETTPSGNGTLAVAKFDDLNGNGLRDEGEPGIADWLMTLYRDGSPLAVQTTGPEGMTVFGDLDPAGEYVVTEETRDGWTPTTPALVRANFSETLHVTVLIGNRMPPTGTATPTPLPTTTPTGSISGSKWHDLDGDHRWDGGEPTLAGWTIYLEQQEVKGSDWVPVGSTTTDASGRYEFTGLAERHYRVYEFVPPGWKQTYPTNNAGMHNLDISNGQPSWAGQDFGNLGTATATPTITATPTEMVTETTMTTTAPTVTETPAPTETATPIPTVTEGGPKTATITPTETSTTTETTTATATPTVTTTTTPAETSTATPTVTATETITSTATQTVADTLPPTETATPIPTVTDGAPATPTVTASATATTTSTTPVATTLGPATPTPTVTEGRPTAVPTTQGTAPTVRTPDPTPTPTPWPTGTVVLPALPSDLPTPVPGLCPALMPSPGSETAITGAGRITDPGFYRFASSFEDVNETVWLDILASNVTIDGNGFALDGRDRTGTHGIRVWNGSVVENVTIQNLTVTDFAYGISLYNTTNSSVTAVNASSNTYDGIMTSDGRDNLIACNVIQQDDDGINLTGTDHTVVINNTVTENFRGSGIHLAGGADNVSVIANRIGYNDEGLEIEDAADSEIARNLVWFSRYYGFNLTRAENLTVDDNYVRNLVNIRPPTRAITGTWNLSGAPGPNLLGGPSIGGNFWGDLNATGFSETRRDLNRDGFTDAPYVLPGGAGIDWLPLVAPAGGADRYLLGSAASWRDWLQTFLR